MKYLFLFIMPLISQVAIDQDIVIPVNDESGMAEYSEVVSVAGASATDLHARALIWINDYYPNPNGTIKSNEEGEKIECKARFKVLLTDKKGNTIGQSYVNYSLTFEFKDGKYRFVIDRINWAKPSYFDVSKWEKKDDPLYQEKTYPSYVEQTVTFMEELQAAFKKGLNTPAKAKSSDW